MTARVRIGTSGWSYRDWVGPFYPDGTAAADYLGIYAERFDVVEVDSTFYGVPRTNTVENWAKRTPDGFLFSPKVPGAVTHGGERQRPEADRVLRDERALASFIEALEPLAEASKLGPVVFQFPYFKVGTLTLQDFVARLEPMLDAMAGMTPNAPRAAVEIRNKGWIKPQLLEPLRARGVGVVLIDHPYMASPRAQLDSGMLTAEFAYLRLLGDRYAIEKTTKSWEKVVLDKSERLDDWAEVIDDMRRRAGTVDIYAFSNNHYAGHGPETSRMLRERVDALGV